MVLILFIFINRERTVNGTINDNKDRNESKLPKGTKSMSFSQKYAMNGTAIMPEEMMQMKQQSDNISCTTDLDIHNDVADYTESYDKVI